MSAKGQVSNRAKIARARAAVKALPAIEREALSWNGIGPGDSYVGLWRIVQHYRRQLAIIQGRALSGRPLKGALEQRERYLIERITEIYIKLLPHEKAKLQSIEVTGDPQHPLHMEVDLSGLPDEDLHALARILPKIGGGAPVDDEPTFPGPNRRRKQ